MYIPLLFTSISSAIGVSSSFSSFSKSLKLTSSSSLLITEISNPNAWNSFINTLNDSGIPGLGNGFPFTIDSYTLTRPRTSSDL